VTTYTFEVLVTLKEGLADPQGKAVESALASLGWTNVRHVRVGKHIKMDVEAADEASALEQVHGMAVRLLSNPVIEEYQVLEAAPK
jgi:phosphoribosylformylglycinamidine synthase PurS subunit